MPPTTSFWDCAERIACSYLLQIPHPPGAPLYLLLGRVFSMFVPAEYVAVSINLMSVLASATSITLLYLIIVRFVIIIKGDPNTYDTFDKIGLYAGALIGALAFSVSGSFWFTATEAETYALSLMFTSLAVWLALKWSENADKPRSERWLVLIAYVFGLAFGVHLLSLLSIFTVALIIYFRKYEFSIVGFIITAVTSVAVFFLIFPFTIITLPTMAGAFSGFPGGLFGAATFFVLLIAFIAGGIYYTHKKGMRLANIAFLAYACILIGYSSYTMIYVRSMANPSIDQNSPDTVERFISYLKREQYGATPLLRGHSFNNATGEIDRDNEKLFPRRHSREGHHVQKYAQYSSDLDFFINYQLGHMYFRYFAWNFIGRDADTQDAAWISGFRSNESLNRDNPAHNRYFYLPFLLGLLGMIFHFQRDWKRALSVLALFLATGAAIVVYLNQFPFQPRERDYSYTGSFFAFSIWIGLGASGLIFMLKELLKSRVAGAYATAALLFLAVPFWMALENYDDNDRSKQYVAPDYAYNLLNSLAPYAIVFTNGDNDTFPLWYLQDVEGIRTDVRVVNLSLLNTPWYILQMKNKWNYDSPPVPISLSDQEIENIESKFAFDRPTDFHRPGDIVIPVNKDRLRLLYGESSQTATAITPTEDLVQIENAAGMNFGIPVDELDDEVRWFFEGTYLGTNRQGQDLHYTRVQDDIVLDILRTNQWERPIYFAITVSQDGQMEMQNYFRLEGKAFRVVPQRSDVNFGWIDPEIHGDRLRSFRFREINNENAYFDENIRRMVDNYRTIITRQASTWAEQNQLDSARHWMRWGEDNIPFTTIEGDITSLVSYAYRYAQFGELDRGVDLSRMGIERLERTMQHNVNRIDEIDDRVDKLQSDIRASRTNVSRRQRLESQLRSVNSSRERLVRDISFDSSRFMILQRVLFMADLDEEALQLGVQVIELTGGRVPFPQSREENRRQVQRIYGD
ncbi:MAG: DUF2723 domain-containing protein [Balneolales bacterium]|nr:DUF2723 domain-containing protein [Balneolales bacterium]